MADEVPGTWLVNVATTNGQPVVRAIVTFTSDGGMVERIDNSVEALIGVWQAEHGHGHDRRFRFMGYRYHQDSTTKNWSISRLRGTCNLTARDRFNGTVTVDSLGTDGTLLPVQPTNWPLHLVLDGSRMTVVPE
jgi:hypothetical protein